jgi:hypothetical protein
MLDLAGGSRAESFLDAFVGLLLGHDYLLRDRSAGPGPADRRNPHTPARL